MPNKYYYLVASLAYLEFEKGLPVTREEFLSECGKWLTPVDFEKLAAIDINDFEMEAKIKTVHNVLKEIGCNKKKMIYVFNKIDLIDKDRLEQMQNAKSKMRNYHPVFVSAEKKMNLEKLKLKIGKNLQ